MLYKTARFDFTIHCQANTFFTFFFIMLAFLALQILVIENCQLCAKIIEIYISNIRSLHIDQGYHDLKLFQQLILQKIVARIKQKNRDPYTQEQLPITFNLLLRLLAIFNQANQAQVTLKAAYFLAFAVFFQAQEFTYI